MITIDLDSPDVTGLLIAVRKARQVSENVKVFISPGGQGFHIKIDKKVGILENICVRAWIGDDPQRLRYSLLRYYVSNDPLLVDVCFDEKNGKKEQEITSLIPKKIPKKYAEVERMAQKLSIPVKQSWLCIFGISRKDMERTQQELMNIQKKDETFTFIIYPSLIPEYDHIVSIICNDKDQAHKRGTWLKANLKTRIDKYWVKER